MPRTEFVPIVGTMLATPANILLSSFFWLRNVGRADRTRANFGPNCPPRDQLWVNLVRPALAEIRAIQPQNSTELAWGVILAFVWARKADEAPCRCLAYSMQISLPTPNPSCRVSGLHFRFSSIFKAVRGCMVLKGMLVTSQSLPGLSSSHMHGERCTIFCSPSHRCAQLAAQGSSS